MPHCHIALCSQPLGFLSSQVVQTHRLQQHRHLRVPLASRGFLLPARLVCRCDGNSSTTTSSTKEASRTSVERLGLWLATLNHFDDCNLKVERCAQGSAGCGYGAFAGAGGVAKGSVVVKVPRKALMTEQTASQCEHIGPLVKKGNLSPWQAMCLHLLFERACGEASFWYPYIALLPTELELLENEAGMAGGVPHAGSHREAACHLQSLGRTMKPCFWQGREDYSRGDVVASQCPLQRLLFNGQPPYC